MYANCILFIYSAFALYSCKCVLLNLLTYLLPFPPLRSRNPLIAVRESGGALKLPQRVRAEPGRQTYFGAI